MSPESTDRWKLVLGTALVFGLLLLGTAVALGKVEEKTSYGFMAIVAILSKVVLDFSEWAFRPKDK